MALAQRHAGMTQGVTKGYPVKAKRVAEKTEPSFLQLVVKALHANAREMREFIVDELVYETMDTLRLLRYIKYQLGFRPRKRSLVVQPGQHTVPPSFQPEPVRILVER